MNTWKSNSYNRNLWAFRDPNEVTLCLIERVAGRFWILDSLDSGSFRSLRAAKAFVAKRFKPQPRTFFFHYNKPASIAAGANRLTVHWQGVCHLVHGIRCQVPIETRNRKSQPRCVMAGKATNITFDNNIATIL